MWLTTLGQIIPRTTPRLNTIPTPSRRHGIVAVDEPANFGQALFDKLWARFQQERGRDPVLQDLAQQRRRVLSLTRLGHLLTYQLGAPVAIGVGEMRWKPTLAGGRDTPYRFTVRRSTIDAAMLQIVDDHGPSAEMTSAGVADTIVRMFIEQTAARR